ncbi:MAG: glycosyltransferase family 39 protein [Anaerolineales bacterium]|nr:glycosyltransferase family 39 protein [Anaerolineales bacterium]MCW5855374.1 glycosyltransferase family 39 protein [Anaerolineales bacterium]
MLKAPVLSPKTTRLLGVLGLIGILLAFAFYCARFIERTSFVVDEQRYYALFDDAMISMQYARNLANGDGLVWNAGGERVEGFSNPGWVLFMALFHKLGLPPETVSLPIQISSAIFLGLNIIVVWLVGRRLFTGELAALLAAGLTGFYFHLNNWALQGMEVGLLTLLLSSAVWLALRARDGGRFSFWPYALLALGTWVRVDMLVPLTALCILQAWQDAPHRRQHLAWGLGLLGASLALQTGLRYWYYGELVPNTYTLKVAGISLAERLRRGLDVFGGFVWDSGWFLTLLPLLLMAFWPDKATLLLFALLAGQVAYSIYVGGDAWEHKGGANRFIALAMPLFFLLFVQVLDKLRRRLLQLRPDNWTALASHGVMAALVFTSLFSFNVIHENDARDKWLTIKRPIFVPGTERYTRIGLLINQITTPEARIAVATAGNIIYFAERYGIDMLGKSDKVIASSAPHSAGGTLSNVEDTFRPGHNKWDYQHSIVQLQPDIVAQIWGSSREMAPYLEAGGFEHFELDGYVLYIRTDSPNVLWDQINSLAP